MFTIGFSFANIYMYVMEMGAIAHLLFLVTFTLAPLASVIVLIWKKKKSILIAFVLTLLPIILGILSRMEKLARIESMRPLFPEEEFAAMEAGGKIAAMYPLYFSLMCAAVILVPALVLYLWKHHKPVAPPQNVA